MSGFDVRNHPSPTGATLAVRASRAGQSTGVVQICHGLAEHSLRYGRFADALAAAGFDTYAHDHRGHGFTTAPDAPPRRFAGEDGDRKIVEDVIAVRDLIAAERPGLPVILFGHSMGGLIALNLLSRRADRYAAGAIWNANFLAGAAGQAARALLAWERFRLGSDQPSRLLPKLTFQAWGKVVPNARTEFDWLSRDPAEVDKYSADPLCGWDASVSLWQDLFRLVFAGADDRALDAIPRDMPLDLVGGEKDPATGGGKAVLHLARRLKRKGFTRVTTTIYRETRHETLNEINRDETTARFIGWARSIQG